MTIQYLELRDVPWNTLESGSYYPPQLLTEDGARSRGINPLGAYQGENGQWMFDFAYGDQIITGSLRSGSWNRKPCFYVNIKVDDSYFDIMLIA